MTHEFHIVRHLKHFHVLTKSSFLENRKLSCALYIYINTDKYIYFFKHVHVFEFTCMQQLTEQNC